ncbi:hypothetical protein BACCIP111895_03920 [Neobacillus rhizosphaerae]|uniref:Uncharacterized protein n=1 Tax=Neobacillus rhizosphaerae TaxID=2880965 RepID=A0ABN8KVS9_9BACI|nr:hypothetical protein BACCIP111895_03920 [Neobacillus rhizosphaerae]
MVLGTHTVASLLELLPSNENSISLNFSKKLKLMETTPPKWYIIVKH